MLTNMGAIRRGLFLVIVVAVVCASRVLADPEPSEDFDRIPKNRDEEKCYDIMGRPKMCRPPFENAAYNVLMEATNTCGQDGQPTHYCPQKDKMCRNCYEGDHPPSLLTDQESLDRVTWWQSQTMYEMNRNPSSDNKVDLILKLGKTFDITYIRVLFESPRPESWGIYKRKNESSEWQPYQFYSASCRDTYRLPDEKETTREDDTRVLCTNEYSDIVPLSKGTVAFSTLEGRPSAYYFETNSKLQEWVQATDIRISLDKMNTFGDEVFGGEQIFRSYYYAIADIAVGARCACNGHAGECVNSTSIDGRTRRVCSCEHYTDGPDCNMCLPFYNDAPWARATTTDAHECKRCNCNGYSETCYFDEELYRLTNHGGHCVDCSDNRAGPNCERCQENFYGRASDGYCIACNCNGIGSRSLQCNSEGKCQCKTGVTGDKCDRCAANFFDFGNYGCSSCECNLAGSYENNPSCDPSTGTCTCKDNVEGKQCRECRPGFFNLAVENEFGCTPCFCYGHASVCQSATGYYSIDIHSMFARGPERWTAMVDSKSIPVIPDTYSQSISIVAPDRASVYFVAPERFLGDQRASYNQDLSFVLRIGQSGAAPTASDIVLEGGNGKEITHPIFGADNKIPSTENEEFRFRLHEHKKYGWQPHMSSIAFMSILSNLTAIKIRGTYTNKGQGFLSNVKLGTARRGVAGEPVKWVEHCQCPEGYVGQFCESCQPGFHHDPQNGGPFARCVPCNCNGHADICEAETGKCICQHNTAGNNCEHCARGFYGHPLKGTPDDCQPCPCPDDGPCVLLENDPSPVCSACPDGRSGRRCEYCSDGYFGKPAEGIPCRPCECNNNIDLNAVRNCNQETGECLKCVNNTGGYRCERCLEGYYGNALSVVKEEGCKLCQCYPQGTVEHDDGSVEPCDPVSGHCQCKVHVTGRNCDKCNPGYYDINSGEGCAACECNPEGSLNRTCDAYTGQCQCRPGITGRKCDACLENHYGFGREGCKPCDCDRDGSLGEQCDAFGQCPCMHNVEGRRCDRCKENKYNRQAGCADCPLCYNLVQDAVNKIRHKLGQLESTLRSINNSRNVIKDTNFEDELQRINDKVTELLQEAKRKSGGEKKSLADQLKDLRDKLHDIDVKIEMIGNEAKLTNRTTLMSSTTMDEAEKVLESIENDLEIQERYLTTDGEQALREAQIRADEIGQENAEMTEIAQKARKNADSNVQEAERIRTRAEEAYNNSKDAMNAAIATITKHNNISEDINKLESQLNELNERFEDAKDRVNKIAQKSADVNKKALQLLIMDNTLPKIDTAELQSRIDEINDKAKMLKEDAQTLMKEKKDFMNSIEERVRNSTELVKQAQLQQTETADLLADIDKAKHTATEAVERGNRTLHEALHTLEKLNAFDAEIQQERAKAEEAMKNVNEIEEMIRGALQVSTLVQRVLTGSEQNAKNAQETTQNAQKNAGDASKNATRIRDEAISTKDEARSLLEEAENLNRRITFTETTIKELEDRDKGEDIITNEVSHQLGLARANVSVALKRVEKALDDVKEIQKELRALPEIDDADLDRLERRLNATKAEIAKANLNEKIHKLTDAKNSQAQWVQNYEAEVDRLTNEVKNIKDIRDAFPNRCFNVPNIES